MLDCVSAPFSLGSLTGRHGLWLVDGSANDHSVALDLVDRNPGDGAGYLFPVLLKSCCIGWGESLASVLPKGCRGKWQCEDHLSV